MLYWKLVEEYKGKIINLNYGGMHERDTLSDNASYTLKSTTNNKYCQGYNVIYFSFFGRTE